jgi:hypothetical protein
MNRPYEARWVSKPRAQILKRRLPHDAILLDVFSGFIVVQPVGSDLGDGPVLSPQEAEFELQPAWFLGHKPVLLQARRKLGLGSSAETPVGAGA